MLTHATQIFGSCLLGISFLSVYYPTPKQRRIAYSAKRPPRTRPPGRDATISRPRRASPPVPWPVRRHHVLTALCRRMRRLDMLAALGLHSLRRRQTSLCRHRSQRRRGRGRCRRRRHLRRRREPPSLGRPLGRAVRARPPILRVFAEIVLAVAGNRAKHLAVVVAQRAGIKDFDWSALSPRIVVRSPTYDSSRSAPAA